MKKIISIMFAAMLCMGVLAGCSDSDSSYDSEPKTAEEAAAQYYYDKDGHIQKKD